MVAVLRLWPRSRQVASLAAWSLVQALPALASGWVLAEAAGMFLTGRTAAGLGWLSLLGVAALLGAVGTRQSFLCLGTIVEPLRDELVSGVVGGALRRSVAAGRQADTDAVARLTHQAEIVRDAYAGTLTVAATFVFTTVSTVAGMATLAPATLPFVLPPLIVAVLILRLLLRPFAVRQRRLVIGEELVARSASAAVSGLRDVTACGAEITVLASLDEQIRRQADAARSAARIGAVRLTCLGLGGWAPLLLVLGFTPSLLRAGVSPAHVIGVLGYLGGSLRNALYTLSQGLGAGLVRLTVTLERIREVSSQAPAVPVVPGAASGRELTLTGVWFGYGGGAEPVIRDLSLTVAPGDHLAIIGPSGVGKSSLAGLIAGLLAPVKGEVLLDGAPAAGDRWRVLIPQEAYVFGGTLAENLLYLRRSGASVASAASAEVDAAIEAVGLGPLASRLGGLSGTVYPTRLSAGERQLIALTRAYLSPAPIAILDEATCHLDPAAEERAEAAFADRPGALIVVAHRISSALRARRTLVLDGSSAQLGDHAELLACSPMYRDLVGYWTGATGPIATGPIATGSAATGLVGERRTEPRAGYALPSRRPGPR